MLYIIHMIRTQIYLPEQLYLQIRLMARQQNLPAAKVIRKLMVNGIKKTKRETLGEAMLNLAKHASSKGPRDLSTRHDDYLYGNG